MTQSNGQETYLRVGIDGRPAQEGERVVKRSLQSIDDAAVKSAMTWKQFVASNMSEAMKLTGSHGAAMRKMSEDWKQYKESLGSVASTTQNGSRVITRSLDDISSSTKATVSNVSQLKNLMLSMVGAAAGIYSVTMAVQTLRNFLHETLKYMSGIETAGLGIAASFMTGGSYILQTTGKALQGQQAMKAAQMDSINVIEELKVANMKTIATLDQLIHGYQETLPVALAKGFNKTQIKDFTLGMVQAAGVIDSTGRLLYGLGEETRSLLTGRIMPGQSRIAQVLGIRPEDIRQYQGNAQGLFDFLMGKLKAFQMMGAESQKTWAGLWSNTKDVVQQLASVAFDGLFTGVKEQLQSLQNYMFKIDESTGRIKFNPQFEAAARSASTTLRVFFDNVVAATRFVYEHWEVIKTIAEAYIFYKVAMLSMNVAHKLVEASTYANIAAEKSRKATLLDLFNTESVRLSQQTQIAAANVRDTEQQVANTRAHMNRALALREEITAQINEVTAKQQSLAMDAELLAMNAKKAADKAVQLGLLQQEKAAQLNILNDQRNALKEFNRAIGSAGANVMINQESLRGHKELVALTRQKTLADAAAAEALDLSTAAQLKHDAAVRNSNSLTALRVQNNTDIMNITKKLNAETGAASSAAQVHTAALAAQSVGARLTAGAMNMLRGAVAFLGGPVGAILTLLGLGATAWSIWGNSAEKANRQALDGTEDVLKSMEDQLKKLRERNRLEEESDKRKKGVTAENTLGLSDAQLDRVKQLRENITKLEDMIGPSAKTTQWGRGVSGSVSTLGGAYSDADKVKALNLQLQSHRSELSNILNTKRMINEEEAKVQYQNKPGKVDNKGASEIAAIYKQITDAYLQYQAAFKNRAIQEAKNLTQLEVAELNHKHDLMLMSEQQFNDAKYAIQQKGFDREIAAVQERRDILTKKIKDAGFSLAEVISTTQAMEEPKFGDTGDKSKNKIEITNIKLKLELAKDYMNVLKEMHDLETAKAESRNSKPYQDLKLTKDLTTEYHNLSAAMKEARGDALGGVVEKEQRVLELLKEQKENLKKGTINDNTNQQILNIDKQIETAEFNIVKAKFQQLKVQTELKAQLLEQAGLSGQAQELRDSIVPFDPEKMGLNPVIRSLETMNNQLREAIENVNQLHRNDAVKFEIEDIGVDEFTKRERDIQRAYKKTYDTKTALLKVYSQNEEKYATEIAALKEDLDAADLLRNAQLNDNKRQMTAMYADLAGQLFTGLADTQDQSTRKGFETAKAFNIAAAVMSTASAIITQLSGPDGWTPAAWARSIAAGVLGAIQIAKIASTSFGSGGSASSGASYPGGFSGGSGVGSKIGTPATSLENSMSQSQLKSIADDLGDASVSLRKVSEGLTKVADMFTDGSFMSRIVGTLSGTQGYDVEGGGAWNWSMRGASQVASTIRDAGHAIIAGFTLDFKNLFSSMGSFTKNLLGGNFVWGGKTSTQRTGIALTVDGGNLTAADYADMKKDGGWFRSNKYWTEYAQNQTLTDAMQYALNQVKGSINLASAIMGTRVNYGGVTMDTTKIQTSGRSDEDIKKDLQTWFENASNAISKNVEGLKDFTFYGEKAFDALIRLSTSLQTVNEKLELIGARLITSSLEGANTAYQLTELMGGSEQFSKAVDQYFESMFTDVEQNSMKTAQAQKDVNEAFRAMGRSVPGTRQQFQNLVNSLDLTTERGAATFKALMDIAEAAGTVYKQAEEFAKNTRELTNDLHSRMLRLNGENGAADIYDLLISQEDELQEARDKGLDVTQLMIIQQLELEQAVKKLSETFTDAQQSIIDAQKKLVDASRTSLLDMVSTQETILNTIKQLTTGPLALLSPEAAYQQAKDQFAKSDIKSMSANATAFLEASKTYNAGSGQYWADREWVLGMLGNATGLGSNPTLDAANAQLENLVQIRDLIDKGNTEQLLVLKDQLAGNIGLNLLLTGYLGNIQQLTAITQSQSTINTSAAEREILMQQAKSTWQSAISTYLKDYAAYQSNPMYQTASYRTIGGKRTVSYPVWDPTKLEAINDTFENSYATARQAGLSEDLLLAMVQGNSIGDSKIDEMIKILAAMEERLSSIDTKARLAANQ